MMTNTKKIFNYYSKSKVVALNVREGKPSNFPWATINELIDKQQIFNYIGVHLDIKSHLKIIKVTHWILAVGKSTTILKYTFSLIYFLVMNWTFGTITLWVQRILLRYERNSATFWQHKTRSWRPYSICPEDILLFLDSGREHGSLKGMGSEKMMPYVVPR